MEMIMIMIGKRKVQPERHESSNPNSTRDNNDSMLKQQTNDSQKTNKSSKLT